jgi:hypothetical protein
MIQRGVNDYARKIQKRFELSIAGITNPTLVRLPFGASINASEKWFWLNESVVAMPAKIAATWMILCGTIATRASRASQSVTRSSSHMWLLKLSLLNAISSAPTAMRGGIV